MTLLLSGRSYGQDKDSIRVSKNLLIECELNYLQLEFVKTQLDSIVKTPRITNKDRLIWSGIGAGVGVGMIIILRMAIGK